MKKIGYIDARRLAGFILSGASALNGARMDISDIATPSSGTMRGFYINYNQNGAKAGAEVNAFAIDLALKKALTYGYAQAIYLSSSGNPAIDYIAPISIYVDDLGTGCGALVGIDIGLALTNSPADRHCFIRMRNHVATIVKDGIRVEGSSPIDHLIGFETDSDPIVAAAVGGSQNHKIRVRITNTDYFIPLNTA